MTNETRTPPDHCGIVEVDPADFNTSGYAEEIGWGDYARGLLEGTTPGPWQWVNDDDIEQAEHPHHSVAEVVRIFKDDDRTQRNANARLIAAAPDLAHALIAQSAKIAELTEQLTDAMRAAAKIGRARGRRFARKVSQRHAKHGARL